LETTRFFVNNELIREETTDLAVDPQEFRLNINTPAAPAAPFASAFSAALQPTSNPSENQVFIFEIDSLVVIQFDPADSPPPIEIDLSETQLIFDLTEFDLPDFSFLAFQSGFPTNDGFAISLSAAADNFGGITDSANLLIDNFTLTEETEFLVEAIIGENNDTDLVLAVREASGEFFSISIPAADLADDGQAIVGVNDFFFNGDFDDGIPNSEIIEISLQSPFASGNAVDVIFQTVSVLASEPAFVLGDCDLDGDVDFMDIPALIEILIDGIFLEQADCDLSGAVDFADIFPFIFILSNS